MQNEPQNEKHNQHHNGRNRQTGNIALAEFKEAVILGQTADRVAVGIYQSQTTENSHRRQGCDKGRHLAVGNYQAVDTAQCSTDEAGQHDTEYRIHTALDKAAHECTRKRKNTADGQINTAG